MPKKQTESLVDWVLQGKGRPEAPTSQHGSMHLLPEDTIGLPRFIPITLWIELLLGEHAPHQNTLLRWVHNGHIHPQPIKIGRRWHVRKDAAYLP